MRTSFVGWENEVMGTGSERGLGGGGRGGLMGGLKLAETRGAAVERQSRGQQDCIAMLTLLDLDRAGAKCRSSGTYVASVAA